MLKNPQIDYRKNNLRRNLYGDAAIGAEDLEMIKIARSHKLSCGFYAKFCGSSGAIVVMLENPIISGYKPDEP